MKYTVDGWNNFCRVFEMPRAYPPGFCFDGGKPVDFTMVDWFQPVEGVDQAAVSKAVWREKVGEIETKEVDDEELAAILVPFIKEKFYRRPDRNYLVACDFGAALMILKEEETDAVSKD